MNINQLEFYLQRGDKFGFSKKADYNGNFGWLELYKSNINEKIFSLFATDKQSPIYISEKLKKEKPYVIEVCELDVKFYENDIFPNANDYVINEVHRFSTLGEVVYFLISIHQKKIEDIKWMTDIPSI